MTWLPEALDAVSGGQGGFLERLGASCTAGLIRPGLTSDGESIVFQKGEGLPCFGPKAKSEIPNE